VNWFNDEPPALILKRARPSFPFPTPGQSDVPVPSWLTFEVWEQAKNVFALPPVSENYPQNDGQIFTLNEDNYAVLPIFLSDEDFCNFSAEWNAGEGNKGVLQSLPCIAFGFNDGPVFRIPAVHHQLLVHWLIERSSDSNVKEANLLDWETKKRTSWVRRKSNKIFL
jgi:hypothetical protein